MKIIKNKKTLIILLVLCIGLVGITIAYFSNSTILDNLFSTKPYGTTYTETFVSPDNWLPGDTTDKTVTVTNSGSVDEAVRISLTESWKSNNGTTLSGLIDENGLLTDIEENSEKAAIINFSNTDDWTYNNGYYYYNYRLQPNETTSSFIESVTFNPKVSLGNTCTETESNGKKTITCNSSGNDYDNATYKLTLTIETVQYNKYMSAWNTDIAIANNQALFCDYFEVGEVVDYKGSEYYVLKDSSTEDDYVTLIKKDPLTASEVNQYSTDYVSQNGEYPYFESDTCNENNQTGCSTNYDTSDVKKIIDGWSSSFSDDLVSVDGYKADLLGNHYYDFYSYDSKGNINIGTDMPSMFLYNNPKKYWSNVDIEDSNLKVVGINYSMYNEYVYNKLYIRPVINTKKKAISGACYNNNNNNNEYFACEVGNKVLYDNQVYYVLENSSINKKYVTLLKETSLTAEEINQYSTSYVSQDGEYPYYQSNTCNQNDKSGCSNDYAISSVKELLDSWASKYKNDLYKLNGFMVKLLSMGELEEYLGYQYNYSSPDTLYVSGEETPEWAYINGEPYWSMTRYSSNSMSSFSDYQVFGIRKNASSENIYNKLYVRPVIYLRKKAIENGCIEGNIEGLNEYKIGETITYRNNDYCVIDNSEIDDAGYVTLIKQEPLTYDELVTYNNGYEIERDSIDNNSGIISYYKSDNCYDHNDYTGCNTDYNDSFVKNIINNWSNSISNDLIEVNGYKARLLKYDELTDLGHIYYPGTPGRTEKSSIDCLYSDADYWTMTPSIYSSRVHIVANRAVWGEEESHGVFTKSAIRPVINLKKCAIDNTCE